MKMNKEIMLVHISDIIPNRFQPRLTFNEESLKELSESIKEIGIIQPLILRDIGDKYEIIAGERRYKAAEAAGLEVVPAIIGSMDDQMSAELALIENLQRENLNVIEEAKSYKKILDMGNFTQEELAKRMGKGQSTIANKLRLLSLANEVQDALLSNSISERHARSLLQIKDEQKQKEVLNKIINERMSVKLTDEYIKNMNSTQQQAEETILSDNLNRNDKSNNEANDIEIPKNDTNLPEQSKELSVGSNYEDIGNPNVYAQDKRDFVKMDSLNQNGNNISNTSAIPAYNKEENTDIKEELPQLENKKEEKVKMENTNIENKENSLNKIKLATAIRLAKDTVEDIKTAGYSVTLEEIDEPGNYKLVINVQK